MGNVDTLYDPAFRERLISLAVSQAAGYQSAAPFPHAVMDDFLPADALEQGLAIFPRPGEIRWEQFDSPVDRKLALFDIKTLPPYLRDLLFFLNSSVMLEFLQVLTGIKGLLPDPYLFGGGLHQIERGGFLKIHADFNRLGYLNLTRRLNLLIYLNKDWQEEYGGHLELWDTNMTRCERKILPVFNRCVVFNTTSNSWHGHPTPLTCPEERSRKSIAIYYYTAGTVAESDDQGHLTLWQKRPGEDSFETPPTHAAQGAANSQNRLKHVLKRIMPPILVDALRRFRN